jgi:hypothetical protein
MSRPIFWTCETRVEPLLFATAAAFFFGDNLLRRPIDWRDAELAPLDFRQQQVCAFLRGLPQETMAADRSNVCRYMAADVLIVSKQRFIGENCQVHMALRRIATRYDRLARNYLASVCLAAALVWWV